MKKQAGNQSLFHQLLKLLLPKEKQQPATTALLEKIAGCRSIAELKTLLLSKEVVLDEQLMTAFDKRIAELEEQTGKPFLF
jgi:hypothetical protein